eukprot:m.32371 g.32371  ORF g.32371 m.32371 type:complete len:156 (+) comp12424_c1_seq1:257-724(+)
MPVTTVTTTTVKDGCVTTTSTTTSTEGGAPAPPTAVPEDVVRGGLTAFEKAYNEDDMAFCGACYTKNCHVTVNGGTENGGFGPFTTPTEVADFLSALRNELGGTNIKFAVDGINGASHVDSWVADNGTGTCAGSWVQEDGQWKMERDVITFTPKA